MNQNSTNKQQKSLWRNRDYIFWFAADASDQLGIAMRLFSFTMITFAVTGDAQLSGFVTTVGAIVLLSCQLPGGVIVDRLNRKTVILFSAMSRAIICLGAIIFWLLGYANIWLLLTTNILLSINAGLFGSATNSALKQIVSPDDFVKANSANQSRDAPD